MKILHLHDEGWDSGIAHYALTLGAALRERGHQVLWWGPAGAFSVRHARELGFWVREWRHPWLQLPSLRRAIREQGVELIDAHTGSAQALAAALSWGQGIRVVRTRADARLSARHPLARLLAARTHCYVAASKAIADDLAAAFPRGRVVTVPPGIPAPSLPAVLPREPVVGLLGRLDPVKGHDDFLDAAVLLHPRFPQARFLAAGGGPRLDRLRWQADNLRLDGAVRFLGFVSDAWAFIAGCRIGVVASTGSEAVSRAALEWMALGRPLVATKVGCLPELVDDELTGLLVPPGDPKALAQAVAALLADPVRAEAMGRAALERFRRNFTVERLADDTERLFAELPR